MKDKKLNTVSKIFEGNEIRNIWDSEKEEKPIGLKENLEVAKKGGMVANDARKSYEKATKYW